MTPTHRDGGNPQNRSAQNTFTALRLDRAPRRRRDPAWLRERLQDPTTRFLPVWGPNVLVTDASPPRPVWLGPEDAEDHVQQAESAILLGEDGRHTYFALGLPDSGESPSSHLAMQGAFRHLRDVAALLDEETAALLAYATAMVYYHDGHRFCGRCGAPTASREGGYLRVCTNSECGQHDFPRTDPAIIVLVSSGERCLLGRQPTWPENLYSIIAGFVEPGESLEAAVVPEVREETGIGIQQVRYHSSQPWPFPRSLMIGFRAIAASTTIRLKDGELEDARWLSREEIAQRLTRGTLQLPSPISISHRLIETWFNAAGSEPLKDVLASA